MLPRSPRAPSTIVIDGSSVLLSEKITVDSLLPARGVSPTRLSQIISQSLSTPAEALDSALIPIAPSHPHKPIADFTFTQKQGMNGVLWHAGASYQLVIKGSPEQVLRHCDLTDNELEAAQLQVKKLSRSGASIVAVAEGLIETRISSLGKLPFRQKLTFMGFVSFTSTPSGSLQQLIRAAKRRHTTFYLVTGAHQQTTIHLAKQYALIKTHTDIYDSRKLAIAEQPGSEVRVFAGATPEQKTAIIDLLRARDSGLVVVDSQVTLRRMLEK